MSFYGWVSTSSSFTCAFLNYRNTSRDLTTAMGFLDANLATPESTDPEEGTPLLLDSPTSPAITQGVIMPPASW